MTEGEEKKSTVEAITEIRSAVRGAIEKGEMTANISVSSLVAMKNLAVMIGDIINCTEIDIVTGRTMTKKGFGKRYGKMMKSIRAHYDSKEEKVDVGTDRD